MRSITTPRSSSAMKGAFIREVFVFIDNPSLLVIRWVAI
jgi:hypothetical protein